MRPLDLQPIGNELAVKWNDGSASFIPLEKLRQCCPCASCRGEADVLGNVHKNPEPPLPRAAFELVRVAAVGGYAIQAVWADGHATGIYSFDYLRRITRQPQSRHGGIAFPECEWSPDARHECCGYKIVTAAFGLRPAERRSLTDARPERRGYVKSPEANG